MNETNGQTARRDAIYVAVRVRPMPAPKAGTKSSGNWCALAQDDGKTLLAVRDERKGGAYLKSQQGTECVYEFDATFGPEATQAEIYETTARRHVEAVARGDLPSATVLAYGATSAGKTHTILGEGSLRHGGIGSSEEEASFGVIPRAVSTLFEVLGQVDKTQAVLVSYLELYNEKVYDLLSGADSHDDTSSEENRRKAPLLVCEDEKNGVVKVLGLTSIQTNTAAQIMELVRKGSARRTTEATGANDVSSRSHAVLMLSVGGRTVSMVDLAGSERASATGNRGQRLAEAAAINRSLLALANCINALTDPTAPKPKFRDSKLTLLLKTSLENSITRPVRLVVLACVSPAMHCVDDTHNTLKYAHRAKEINAISRSASDSMPDAYTTAEVSTTHEKTNLRQQSTEGLSAPPPKPARGFTRRGSISNRRFSVSSAPAPASVPAPVPAGQEEIAKQKKRGRRASLHPPQQNNAPLGELRRASSIAVAEARAAAAAAAQSLAQKQQRPASSTNPAKRRNNYSLPPVSTATVAADSNAESLRIQLDDALDRLRDAEDRAERWKAVARDGREQTEALVAACRACVATPDDVGALRARWTFLEGDIDASRRRFERAVIDDDALAKKSTSHHIIDKRVPLTDNNTVLVVGDAVKRCIPAASPEEHHQQEQLPPQPPTSVVSIVNEEHSTNNVE